MPVWCILTPISQGTMGVCFVVFVESGLPINTFIISVCLLSRSFVRRTTELKCVLSQIVTKRLINYDGWCTSSRGGPAILVVDCGLIVAFFLSPLANYWGGSSPSRCYRSTTDLTLIFLSWPHLLRYHILDCKFTRHWL